MKGDKLPRTDHVALHCKPTDLTISPSGAPDGLKIDAFRIDDDGISVDWLEYVRGAFDECFTRVTELQCALRKVRANHRCAILNVGRIIDAAVESAKTIDVVHDPIEKPKPNPAHSLIRGLTKNDDLILTAMRLSATLRSYGAAALKISKRECGA